MLDRYWVFPRQNGVFYFQDKITGKQQSARTKDKAVADRLLAAKNQSAEQPMLNRSMAKTYLAAKSPELMERTWSDVIARYAQGGSPESVDRKARAFRSQPFARLLKVKLIDTEADHQRELARSVYRAVKNRLNLFVEAPTGMGKTLATLYPAIKALPLLADGKVFYVTAKTLGRLAAQDALQRLRDIDVHVRSVSLTAKSKICFAPDASGCDPTTCPFRKGYYDRYKPAMRELLETQRLDSANISKVARKHQVCPHELSLDVSNWVDVIIGDYNYVFDPTVMLQRYFDEGAPKHVVLIDEAHNLVDRSREMYSASLTAADLSVALGTSRDKADGKARLALAGARDELEAAMKSPPSSVLQPKSYHRAAFAAESISEWIRANKNSKI